MSQDANNLAGQLADANVETTRAAAESLMLMGEEAQPAAVALVSAAGHADDATRESIVAALEELGPPTKNDLDSLSRLLETDNSDVAYWAATLIGRLEEDAAAATAPLAAVLGDDSKQLNVRERCVWALERIGPGASAAVSSLESAASSTEPRLSRLAKQALESIAGE